MRSEVVGRLLRRLGPGSNRRLVLALCVQTLVLWLGASSIVPMLPAYLRTRGASTALVGVVMAAYYAASVLTQYPAGRLSDRIGRRPVLVGGLGLFAAGSVGFALTTGAGAAIAFRALQGCGAGAVTVSAAAMIGAEIPEGSRGGAFGALYGSQTLALAIGPLIGSIAGARHMGALFVAASVTAALAALPVLAGVRETRGPGRARPPAAAPGVPAGERWALAAGPAEAHAPAQPALRRGLAINPAVVGVVIAFAANGLIIGTYETNWTLLLQFRGASAFEVGLSWTLFALPFAVLSVPAGKLADRADRRVLAVASLLVSALFMAVYTTIGSPVLLVGLAVVEAVGTVAATPAAVLVLSEAVPPGAQGEAQGAAETARTAAAAAAAAVSGALFGIGPSVPFLATAGVIAAAGAVVAVVWRRGWSRPSERLRAEARAAAAR